MNIRFKFGEVAALCGLLLLLSCSSPRPYKPEDEDKDKREYREALVQANKYLVKQDNEVISNFVKRMGWDMILTQSGLWYQIYHHANGDSIKEGMMVELAYKLSLLDGTLCYSSDSLGLKTFRVGRGGVEPGLEEAILFLSKGDKARIILQPFLAHGLIGDNNCIPARATILYDIEVVSLKR